MALICRLILLWRVKFSNSHFSKTTPSALRKDQTWKVPSSSSYMIVRRSIGFEDFWRILMIFSASNPSSSACLTLSTSLPDFPFPIKENLDMLIAHSIGNRFPWDNWCLRFSVEDKCVLLPSVPIDYRLIIHVSWDSDCQLACRYALGALKLVMDHYGRAIINFEVAWVEGVGPIIDGNGNCLRARVSFVVNYEEALLFSIFIQLISDPPVWLFIDVGYNFISKLPSGQVQERFIPSQSELYRIIPKFVSELNANQSGVIRIKVSDWVELNFKRHFQPKIEYTLFGLNRIGSLI